MVASISKNPLDKKEVPRLQPLLFEAWEADGGNYMRWSIDAKTNLTAEELEGALISPTLEHLSTTEKCWTSILLRRHLDTSLQQQCIQIDDPTNL